MSGTPGVWFARHTDADGGVVFVGVLGTEFPDGAIVDIPGPPVRPAGWQGEAHVPVPGAVPTRVVTAPETVPGAPHLWTVLLAAGDGDQVDLVAFSTDAFPDGTVVGQEQFQTLGITWANQVAAVRWSPSTGLVSQLYVAAPYRRMGIALKMLTLVGGVRVAMGWTPLRTDGRFTDLGAAWLQAAPQWWQPRIPERAAHLPPMTPAGETAGVPARNLLPDPA